MVVAVEPKVRVLPDETGVVPRVQVTHVVDHTVQNVFVVAEIVHLYHTVKE